MTKEATKDVIYFNAGLTIFIAFSYFILNVSPTTDYLLQSVDSKTYFNTGAEFFQLNSKGDSIIRPFLYSTILRGSYAIGGPVLVVLLQTLFYMVAANLMYATFKLLCTKKRMQLLLTSLFVINISLISLIYHGLTEIITTMLLAILTYLTVKAYKNVSFDAKYYSYVVLICGLFTVIKPLFFYPFIALLLFTIIYQNKRLFVKPAYIVIMLLAITPVLVQMSVMKIKYDQFTVSTISKKTLDHYLLAQGYRHLHQLDDIDSSKQIISYMSSEERKKLVLENKGLYARNFLMNIKKNITGDGWNILYLEEYGKPVNAINFMNSYNEMNFLLYLIFLPLFFLAVLVHFIRGTFSTELWTLLVLGAFYYYIIFTSGISFWQNDRLIIFALPIMLPLYYLIVASLASNLKHFNYFKRPKP